MVLKDIVSSINDNFFEIGGHSLLATQVTSRIRKDLQIEISLRSLFASPTISGIREEIALLEGKEGGNKVLAPAIVAEIRPERIPLSFAQQRLWFLDQLLPNQSLYNIPMALRLNLETMIPMPNKKHLKIKKESSKSLIQNILSTKGCLIQFLSNIIIL